MINLKMSTMIYQPVRQVFDFVSTPENDFQWQYGTLATASLSEDVSKIGTFFRSIGHLMGRRVQGTFEVTEYEPNRKYSFKSLSGSLHAQTSYTFERGNSSTTISVSTQASMVDFFHFDEGILEKRMRRQLKENLAVLKDLLEAKRFRPALNTNSLTVMNKN